METLMDILQWLVPSGGLATAIAWLGSKTIRNIRTTKEINDTYKTMYDNLKGTLIDLEDDIKRLYKQIGKLERAVAKAATCVHYRDCPIERELREQEGDAKPKSRNRQLADKGN
ncbi:hypothetical protein FACS1894199_11550 [Bacteroidia bacterium]|nr:hypothetical protein FACS1894199_11550 [Bacteroidia bacterium]